MVERVCLRVSDVPENSRENQSENPLASDPAGASLSESAQASFLGVAFILAFWSCSLITVLNTSMFFLMKAGEGEGVFHVCRTGLVGPPWVSVPALGCRVPWMASNVEVNLCGLLELNKSDLSGFATRHNRGALSWYNLSATCPSKDSGPLQGLYLCLIVLSHRCIRTELITLDLICPLTYQLLRNSGGDSGPNLSFDKSASLERLFGLARASLVAVSKLYFSFGCSGGDIPHHLIKGFCLTDILATGGGEAIINLWHDSTATDIVEAVEKEDEVVFVRKYDAKDQVQKALDVRERNTKPKLCHIAQFILFQCYVQARLLGMVGCLEANALVRDSELLIDRRKNDDDQLGALTARYVPVGVLELHHQHLNSCPPYWEFCVWAVVSIANGSNARYLTIKLPNFRFFRLQVASMPLPSAPAALNSTVTASLPLALTPATPTFALTHSLPLTSANDQSDEPKKQKQSS
ncbi:hypothetical protein Tco_1494218 [Tanacetum coccineum]